MSYKLLRQIIRKILRAITMTNRMNFQTKLAGVSIAIVLLTVLSTAVTNLYMSKRESIRQGRQLLSNVSATLSEAVSLQNVLMEKKISADRDIMKTQFALSGFPIPEALMDVEMKLVNQDSGQQEDATLPALKLGASYLHEDNRIVKSIAQMTGADVSVLQLSGERLVRISMSQDSPPEKWGKGSYIDRNNASFSAIMSGNQSALIMPLGNTWRIVAYEPIKDLAGEVLGMLEISHPLLSDAFAEFVCHINVNGDGGTFVLDAQGRSVIAVPDALKGVLNSQDSLSSAVTLADGRQYEIAHSTFAPWGMTFVTWVNTDDLQRGVLQRLIEETALSLFAPLFVSIVLIMLAGRVLLAPLRRMAALANSVADGDYTLTISYPARDAIGQLADALNTMVTRTRDMLADVVEVSSALSNSATELDSVSVSLTENVVTTSELSTEVHASATSMSDNMYSVSAAMEEASVNVRSVAQAAEDLTGTITEVARNTERASQTTSSAVSKAGSLTHHVDELDSAAREISAIVTSISAISSQTHLLALNATIEAARAGDFGRGFGVVANEIKELSRQTDSATEDIRKKVASVQQITSVTTREVHEIISVFDDVHAIVAQIAQAVEEQTATTRNIADNVLHASHGIHEINVNTTSSSAMTQTIRNDISAILTAVETMSTRSCTLSERSGTLASMSGKLQERLRCFKF